MNFCGYCGGRLPDAVGSVEQFAGWNPKERTPEIDQEPPPLVPWTEIGIEDEEP